MPPETPDIRIWLIYGVDVFNQPYDTEADWSAAYRIAERLAGAGLGITVHVAEVAPVNVASVLRMPGITRLGHATHAGYHPLGVSMRLRTPWVFPPMTCWALPGMPCARLSFRRSSAQHCWRKSIRGRMRIAHSKALQGETLSSSEEAGTKRRGLLRGAQARGG